MSAADCAGGRPRVWRPSTLSSAARRPSIAAAAAAVVLAAVLGQGRSPARPPAPVTGLRCGERSDGLCACFSADTPPEYIDAYVIQNPAVPAGAEAFSQVARWTVTATNGAVGATAPITLTYSFVPDYDTGDPATSNVLHATLDAKFGTRAAWQNLFRSIFDQWSAATGVAFVEVGDDGQPWPNRPGVLGARGDIRIVAFDMDGPFGVLAYAYTPNSGDMALDKDENWASPGNDFRFMRNTILHELGHALGLLHVNPRDGTKLMEALLNTGFAGPQDDDVRGVNAYYGDSAEPNDSVPLATNLGAFADGLTRGNLSIHYQNDADFFRISASLGQGVAVEAAPIGATYQVGPDPGTPAGINTLAVNPLRVEVYDGGGATLLASAIASAPGVAARTAVVSAPAGGLVVRVTSAGAAASVQRYVLSFAAGATTARTLSISSTGASGVDVSVSPGPAGGGTVATAPAQLAYTGGETVTLAAPATVGGAAFIRWIVDGVSQTFGATDTSVVMATSHDVVAEYGAAGLAVDAGPDQVIVAGDRATLEAAVLGGTAPLTFAWSPAATVADPGASRTDVFPPVSTTYTVSVSDSLGRSGTDQVRVQVNPALAANAGADLVIPPGGTATLRGSASGGSPPYEFAWSPSAGLSDPASQNTDAAPSQTTVFTLAVTDATGRTAQDSATVQVAAALRASASGGKTLIRGQSTTLSAAVEGGVPPYAFTWSPTDGLAAADAQVTSAAPTRTTVYNLRVADGASQVVSASVRVDVVEPLRVTTSATPAEIEAGQETVLDAAVVGGAAPFRFAWTPTDDLAAPELARTSAAPRSARTYSVTVTDALGQSATSTVSVEVRGAAPLSPVLPASPCGFGAMLTLPVLLAARRPLRASLRPARPR